MMVRARTTLLLALLALTLRTVAHSEPSVEVRKQDQETRKVLRVVDGDTLLLSPAEKVRLIGVNTPETVDRRKPVECFGPEASAYTKKMVEGKTVIVEFDDRNATRLHKDFRGGRTLAYIYLEDRTFLNRELIRLGYGKATPEYRFRYREEFRQLERQAQESNIGLWSHCKQQN